MINRLSGLSGRYLKRISFFLLPVIVFSFIISASGEEKRLTAKSDVAEIGKVVDLAKEADSKGFKISDVQQLIFTSFDVIVKGDIIAKIPVPLYGKTEEGIAYLSAILPASVPGGNLTVYSWINGKEKKLSKNGLSKNLVETQLEFDEGENYVCVVLKDGRKPVARSRVLRIQSPGYDPACKGVPSEDFTGEAKAAGLNPPVKEMKCFPDFSVSSKGSVITETPATLEGKTPEGVADSLVTLPKQTPRGSKIYLWVNGNESVISSSGAPDQRILGKIVLDSGFNYICAVIKKGSSVWGRSPMVKVKSEVKPSIARIELSWDGSGDIDLHLENTAKGMHICYTKTNHKDRNGYVNLDVDNTVAYGPENIRIYELPSETEFRCYLNYYSGGANLKATVRLFDKKNKLIQAYDESFTSADVMGTDQFNDKSRMIGTFPVKP